MFKFKPKPASKKSSTVIKRVGGQLMITEAPKEEPKAKNKVKTPAKKVVYISKRGSKAIFDSIKLCAKIFGKNPTTIKYRIEHPNVRASLDFDWLEGGRLEYLK